MQYIDCKKYAQEILDEVRDMPEKRELYILTMGDDPASQSYVKGKMKDCDYCGIPYSHIHVNTVESLNRHLYRGNTQPTVGGIIVQLPLPDGIDGKAYTDSISVFKDVDGFRENSNFKQCTPEGIMYILEKELDKLEGKTALVIGKGKLVGEPITKMLLEAGVTVTVAHSKTKPDVLEDLLRHNDIIISAVGKPKLIDLKRCTAEIIIDVGVNRDENGRLCGDCYNFQDTGHGMKVTPVPGGIGLMTRAMLMQHMVQAT